MAIADDAGKGLVQDVSGGDLWCKGIAAEIVGKSVELLPPYSAEENDEALPPVLAQGLAALFSGVAAR